MPNSPIQQAKANSDKHADCICDPVTQPSVAVKGRLYQLNNGAKGAPPDEDGEQPDPAGAGQWKDESSEGNEVNEFVSPMRRWRRRL